MIGRNHVASGLAAGLVSLPLLSEESTPTRITWVLGVAGAALLPDLDMPQSSAARVWGPITRVAATGIGLMSGGHRRGTHDAVLASAAFGGLMGAAAWVPGLACAVLALLVGLTLHDVARVRLLGWPLNLVASWLGAGWLLSTHHIDWHWLSLAVILGVVVHIAGDALTNDGVPIPVVWLANRRATWGLRLFSTGAVVETFVVGPALVLLDLWLLLHLNHAGGIPTSWATQVPTPHP